MLYHGNKQSKVQTYVKYKPSSHDYLIVECQIKIGDSSLIQDIISCIAFGIFRSTT
jgi:hypothetical protein